jgi:membrane-associated phospholipid phosphatase
MNTLVLGRVSHQLNTFPSGHVAVAGAAVASVATVSGLAGALLGLAVAGICVGAAAGRYHYVVDVVLGLVVAAVAFLIAAAA